MYTFLLLNYYLQLFYACHKDLVQQVKVFSEIIAVSRVSSSIIKDRRARTYSEPCQTSEIEIFVKRSLIIFAKIFVLDGLQGSEHASEKTKGHETPINQIHAGGSK